ncbi:prepilin-type N-terminal cleavage/methylation domain-containing protein [Candidatus Azambacteria bacterium]|nr:prepilin-type N-terminal cleavage/methylation domain-containing protein [Candidatus Azambacteria bacterium]
MSLSTTYYKIKTNSGFTIIEILLVISIITILSSSIFINRHSAEDTQALNQAAQKLAFDIRRAQTLSLAGLGLDNSNGICGYGIHIENNTTYIIDIYEDKNSNCDKKNLTQQKGDKKLLITLNNGITISTDLLDVIFIPPKPEVIIKKTGNNENTSAQITLTNAGGQKKTIEVTTAGQVNIITQP